MRPLLATILLLSVLVGCDRPDPETTKPVPPVPADDTPFGKPAGTVEPADAANPPDTASSPKPPASRPIANATLEVAGRQIELPPAKLQLLGDGAVVLTADADGAANTMSFQMHPTTDGAADGSTGSAWKRAVWTYRMSSNETESTDGIYSGGPDNGVRPIQLDIELLRDGPLVKVNLRGRFVAIDSEDPLHAPSLEVQGTFDALLSK